MKKAVFTNQYFYQGLIALLLILITVNLVAVVFEGKLIGLVPAAIQSVLIYLIVSKHPFSKKAVQLWALVFLVLAQALRVSGRFLKDLSSNFAEVDLIFYLQAICMLLLGLVVYEYARTTITNSASE